MLFETSAIEMYQDLFEENGRTDKELNYFLSNIFNSQIRAEANFGNMVPVLKKLAKKHPEWVNEIDAFNADQDFIKQVRNTIPEMEKVLFSLKERGANIYGLTNWAGDTFVALKRAYPSILNVFNDVIVSGQEGIKKPDPEFFQLAQSRMQNPNPQNVYFFDDKKENIEAAKKTVGWNGDVFKNAKTVIHRFKI